MVGDNCILGRRYPTQATVAVIVRRRRGRSDGAGPFGPNAVDRQTVRPRSRPFNTKFVWRELRLVAGCCCWRAMMAPELASSSSMCAGVERVRPDNVDQVRRSSPSPPQQQLTSPARGFPNLSDHRDCAARPRHGRSQHFAVKVQPVKEDEKFMSDCV